MTQIANPIYDVVFKYLMDDNRIAKLLISRIIGEEIEELTFSPQENLVEMEIQGITIYRIDFSAKILTPGGETKRVTIEIQKAKFSTDIMRFRKYLGQQYISEENAIETPENTKKAFPIISIYFLGHKLEKINAPIIKIARTYIDMATGLNIKAHEEFIESLTHDSFVIQIPWLKEPRRTELELLLSVFDQSNAEENHHILNIPEENFPEEFRLVIRRLQRAIAEPAMRKKMNVEDEVIEELQRKERTILQKDEIIKENEKVIKENEKVIKENEKVIKENEKVIQENEKAIEEKNKALDEKERIIAEQKRMIEELLKASGKK